MVTENLCPVCGFQMADPPCDYNICPSCGTEFGNHDLNSSIDELRSVWLATGPRWWSQVDPQPEHWDPIIQVLTGVYLNSASMSSEVECAPPATGAQRSSLPHAKRRRVKRRGYSVHLKVPSIYQRLESGV
jgi:hypothetical protein